MLAPEFYKAVEKDEANGVVVANRKGYVQWVNDAFCRICGFETEEVIGDKPGNLLQGEATESYMTHKMRLGIQNGTGAFHIKITNYRKDRTTYQVYINIIPVLEGGGRDVVQFVAYQRLCEPVEPGNGHTQRIHSEHVGIFEQVTGLIPHAKPRVHKTQRIKFN